jgi:hypothetical protein
MFLNPFTISMSNSTVGSYIATCPVSHLQHLPRVQRILDDLAVETDERHSRTGQLLHDEPLAAEEPGAQALAEVDVQPDGLLGAEERLLLDDHHLPFGKRDRHDLAGEIGGEGDDALAAEPR